MRAVVDTNVLVRPTKNATGPARRLLRCFESEKHVLVLSNAILSELIRVLHYPRLRALHGLTTQQCVEYTKALHDASEVVLDRRTRLCTIHPTRPLACRVFDCREYEHAGDGRTVRPIPISRSPDKGPVLECEYD